MDRDDITELFAPVLPVSVRRMFGGHGVYSDGVIFALEIDGIIYLKVDDQNRPFFTGQGSKPFTYDKKTGEQAVMAYFNLPEAAYDEEDLLKDCVQQALGAATRAEVAKAIKAAKSASRAKMATTLKTPASKTKKRA